MYYVIKKIVILRLANFPNRGLRELPRSPLFGKLANRDIKSISIYSNHRYFGQVAKRPDMVIADDSLFVFQVAPISTLVIGEGKLIPLNGRFNEGNFGEISYYIRQQSRETELSSGTGFLYSEDYVQFFRINRTNPSVVYYSSNYHGQVLIV